MTRRVRHVVGCMTGTSLDGLDAALVRIDGEGLDMRATFVRLASRPFDDALWNTLRSLASAEAHPAEDYVRAARALGELHADVVGAWIEEPPAEPEAEAVDFVVAHGQTILHSGDAHRSWQLFDPWPLVRRCKLPVCYDLRQADLIAGGQGAPITPLADWVMYRAHADVVVNLGGIANVTLLHAEVAQVRGADVGGCNLLIDGLCRRLTGRAMDRDGKLSATGRVRAEAMVPIADVLAHDRAGSLGREQLNDARLDRLADQLRARGVDQADALRSAVDYVARMIGDHLASGRPRRVVLAGGGTRNATLVQAIRQRLADGRGVCSDDLGIPSAAREAMAFAVLGALSQDGVPITLSQVTGARNPGRAGCWVYP